MTIDRERWQADVRRWWRDNAADLASAATRLGVNVRYSLLVASAFVPLLAVPQDQLEVALAAIIGSVGANLLSNVLQGTHDQALQRLAAAAADEETRAAIDAVVDEARALDAAAAELGADWDSFAAEVLAELEQLGGAPRTPHIIERIREVGPGVNIARGDIVSAQTGGIVVKAGQVTFNVYANNAAEGIREAGALLGQPDARIEGLPLRDSVAVTTGPDSVTLPREVMDAAPPPQGQREWLARQALREAFGRWQQHFVPLAGVESMPADVAIVRIEGEGPNQRRMLDTIPDVRLAFDRYERFVLLGDPGGGKTTILERLALEGFQEAVRDKQARIPLFVSLGDHKQGSPAEFLAQQWEEQTYRRGLGATLEATLDAGRILLLADGLNELPRDRLADQMDAWGEWVANVNRCPPGNRAVFTCRTLDYERPLLLPQVQILALSPERVQEYMERYLPTDQFDRMWQELIEDDRACEQSGRGDRSLLVFLGNPFVLHAAVEVFRSTGELTRNRGRLIAAFAISLLEREARRLLRPRPRVPTPQSIAVAERYVGPLARLAFEMQARGEGTRFARTDAEAALPADVAQSETLERALGANMLRMDERGTNPLVWFSHQLLQEGLAAHELLRRFNAGEDLSGLWQAIRLATDMPEPRERGEWDPLPPPPPTGWEETTVLAAGLAAGDLGRLLDAVRVSYPVLAARCIDEAGVERESVPDQTRENVQRQLLADLRDERAHLRARIECGLRLGRIGDSRFEPVTGATGVPYVRPALCRVPAGRYLVGNPPNQQDPRYDPDAFTDEQNGTEIALPEFWIGKYPVTNAEYRCFVAAGGYQQEGWWTEDETGWRWVKGEDVGQFGSLLAQQRMAKGWPDDWREQLDAQQFSPEELNRLEFLRDMSEDELVTALRDEISRERRDAPRFWDNPAYAQWVGSSQPVIGASWYEARAYCRWLDAQWRADGFDGPDVLVPKNVVRLPSEAEWEAASRGPEGRRYPWVGDFDPWKANTIEKPVRVLRVSPVGAFPDGKADCGALDMSGNVWEWTRSLWGRQIEQPDFGYPYDPNDGREDGGAGADVLRVVRGGSWGGDRRSARCACRRWDGPDARGSGVGFRVRVAPPT